MEGTPVLCAMGNMEAKEQGHIWNSKHFGLEGGSPIYLVFQGISLRKNAI